MRGTVFCAIFWFLGVFSCDVCEELCVSATNEFSCSLQEATKLLPGDLFSTIGAGIVCQAVEDFGFDVSILEVVLGFNFVMGVFLFFRKKETMYIV